MFFPQGETEEQKLRRELQRAQQRIAEKDDEVRAAREARDAAERSARGYKGRVTRIKNRVSNGVCPCCNRSFRDLHAHMTTKHPTFTKEDA